MSERVNIVEHQRGNTKVYIPWSVYEALDKPAMLVFDKWAKTIQVPTLSQTGVTVGVNKKNVYIHVPGASELIGRWSYELNDLTIQLLDKQ